MIIPAIIFFGSIFVIYVANKQGFFERYKYWINFFKEEVEKKKKADKIIEANFKEHKKRTKYNDTW